MNRNEENLYIARYRQADGTPQTLAEHLEGASVLASGFSEKIGLPAFGELMGLLHDFGKYAEAFQTYIKSAAGKIEPEDDEYVDAVRMRGRIDHSTAGAQYIWEKRVNSPYGQIAAEIMALCIVSHHSGLIDSLEPDGTDRFSKRLDKPTEETHIEEIKGKAEESIRQHADLILNSSRIDAEFRQRLERMLLPGQLQTINQFMLGFLARFLFSSLIDADRLNSAERQPNPKPEWPLLIGILEANLAGFKVRNRIDEIRADISSACLSFADRERGVYQLTVPTGGGKTLASLRFALHHAAKHEMDRIIYVVPYTSIIDQNVRVARSVFAFLEGSGRHIVLEHHSNLTPEQDASQSKLLTENWDAPIIYTTAVQLLETLFAAGTRGVRRLHQLANAVIIFDEIQTIPIHTVHLFNNTLNFLAGQCGSTVVFCTATQPLLHKVDPTKGAAQLSADSQMMRDVGGLFRGLHRVTIDGSKLKPAGWTVEEVADAAKQQLVESGSVLVIVNKKAQARELYQRLQGRTEHVYHLSTSMCPAHRMAVLDKVRVCLDPQKPLPVICVSTQLIEAGVDVDFGSVIRYLAGLDSIAQAAGRCNRNGLRQTGKVLVTNLANEGLDKLPEIRLAQEITKRVLREFHDDPALFDHDLLSPKTMERYYHYYFFQRAHEMAFPLLHNEFGRDDDLLTLLSHNGLSVEAYKASQKQAPPHHLRQSFMSAAKAFKAIDSPTEGVIVPHGRGERIIAELAGARFEGKTGLLKEAQRYSVNFFPYEVNNLKEKGRLYEVWEGSGIFWLDEKHYSEEFGASTEEVATMKTHIV